MDSQAPPLHYPNSHDSTAEVYRTRHDDDDLYSPTLCEGYPGYPLPPYGEGSAPPTYQEDPEELAKAKKKVRKILIIRVMTSVFIALIVSLIVAGAVTRMQQGKPQDRSEETDHAVKTVTGDIGATAERDLYESTAPPATPTTDIYDATASGSFLTFDCQCFTEAASTATSTSAASACDEDEEAQSDEFLLLGVSRYTSPDCRLARASFRGSGDEVRYRCTLSCRDPDFQGDDIGSIMAGAWAPDLEEEGL